MKKILYFLLLISNSAFSQVVVRITAGTNLQTAIDNATAGTAFLIEPGVYGTIIVGKRVILIGQGYFKNTNETEITSLFFNAGSENSIVTGLSINQSFSIDASNITVQRNRLNSGVQVGKSFSANNLIMKQNFIQGSIYLEQYSSNFYVGNNIIFGRMKISSIDIIGQVINNTIINDSGERQYITEDYKFSFINNIITSNSSSSYTTNIDFTNNIISNSSHFLTTDASNKKVADWGTVFVGYPGSNGYINDSRYMLLNTSPAKGAGVGGTDCGAFGGTDPYVLQGLPVGPNIYQLSAPMSAAAGQTFQVQIKAKVQN